MSPAQGEGGSFGPMAYELDQSPVRVAQVAGVVVRVDVRRERRSAVEPMPGDFGGRIDAVDQRAAGDAERKMDMRLRFARHDEEIQVAAVAVALGDAVDLPHVAERGEHVAVEAQVGVEVARLQFEMVDHVGFASG